MILIQTKEKMLEVVLKNGFFKLINNSVYDKTMENLRKLVKVRLINDYKKYIKRQSFVLQKTFNKNFVAIQEIEVLTLDKPD